VELDKYPSSENGIYTSRIKSDPGDQYFYTCPAPIPPTAADDLESIAAAVFRVTACLDVARVDFRLDADDHDRPYVLEVNALPGLCPGYSDLVLAAEACGMSYRALINAIFDAACARYGLL
jgi:D-alanine-D-alanine ligase